MRKVEIPILTAIASGDAEATLRALDLDPATISSNEQMVTPLHLAARLNKAHIADLLLDRGADKEARDSNGLSPSHYAAGSGATESVSVLLKHGADPLSRDKNGDRPIDYTDLGGYRDAAKLLQRAATLRQTSAEAHSARPRIEKSR